MKKKTSKDLLQYNIKEAFTALPIHRALAIVPTGSGKALLSLMIVEDLQPEKILYITNSTLGRDKTMPDEFRKWGMEKYLIRTEFTTYQAAYKWKRSEKDLTGYFIIADEVDFIGTQYSKFFTTYKDIDTFAMTGYAVEKKLKMLKKFFPVVVNITREQLQKEGILNKTNIVFVQYCLSKAKTLLVNYTKDGIAKQFYTSENESYAYFDKWEAKSLDRMSNAFNSGDMALYERLSIVVDEVIPRKRAAFIWNMKSTETIVKQIKEEILENPNNKVIIFSLRTKTADNLSKYTYHGKNSKAVNTKNFADFNSDEIRELSVVGKINRDANMVGLNNLIIAQFNTSLTNLTQITGRGLRLKSNEISTMYMLLPYYIAQEKGKNVIKKTVAVNWAKLAMKAFNLKELNMDLRNLCPDKIEK